MPVIHYQKDDKNIVHLILDKAGANANLMDAEFAQAFADAVDKLLADDYSGVIIRSAKATFFAGGDLTMLSNITQENTESLFTMTESIKRSMRHLETQGKPVVACINGAALGGGWEIALACHFRVAIDDPKLKLGLPEVTLGLLPGAGGITRSVRMLGLQAAMPFLLEGRLFNPPKAKELGLVDQLVATADDLILQAVQLIEAHPDAIQLWDIPGYRMPGGAVTGKEIASMLPIAPAMLRLQSKGVYPAPESILAVMVEGAQVDFETATRIETRYFVELAKGQVAKNMINTLWFQLNEIKALAGRPAQFDKQPFEKVAVLGAGMMGAGIAYACASKGIAVVLKDTTIANAEKGKAYSEKLFGQQIAKGRLSEEKSQQLLALIQPSAAAEELQGCDLVIEAVFENRELKARVTQEAEQQIAKAAVFASNTSTLPISGLAQASQRPNQFIGLHFFSPVEKMPLVEIICGEKTDEQTLARCYDFVLQLGKTPIVVNDSRGFFTSRVFSTFVNEGVAMLGEGVAAASIENAAYLAGFPVGPLAVTDEVSLSLVAKIKKQTLQDMTAAGQSYEAHPAEKIIDRMLELERAGKSTGSGFYDYPKDQKKRLWSGLKKIFPLASESIPLHDIKQRLLFIMAIESVRCVEEGVLRSTRDANVGSIMGIGYPAWTGGVLQFINQTGLSQFIERAEALAEVYGERFLPPQLLIEKAQNNERFE